MKLSLFLAACLCFFSTITQAQWKWAYMYRTYDDFVKGIVCDSLDMYDITETKVTYYSTVKGKTKLVRRKLSSVSEEYWGCRWKQCTWDFRTRPDRILKLFIDGDIRVYGSHNTDFYYNPAWEVNQQMMSQMTISYYHLFYFQKGSGSLRLVTNSNSEYDYLYNLVKDDSDATAALNDGNKNTEAIFRAIRAVVIYNSHAAERKFEQN